MLFRKKNKKIKADLSVLHTDMHSHLIPGIDDGSPDMITSLHLISGMVELGYKKLITTPHIMQDMYPNKRDDILRMLEPLKSEVRSKGLDVEIIAAAEYFLDDHVSGLLKNKEPLLAISGNMILVEFSMVNPSFGLKEILFEMQMQGYTPVIAHPERYVYLEGNRDFFEELKTIGCLFQLNLLSLTGYYGKNVYEFSQYLAKKNSYDLIGTDLHNSHHLESLHDSRINTHVQKLLDSGKIINTQL